jgi:uncharacterized protein GlcG (DUF336 family)
LSWDRESVLQDGGLYLVVGVLVIELTLEMAEKAVKAAHAKAMELGTPMTVGVVDEGGRLLLLSRGDGAGPLSPDIAIAKAVAAVGFRLSTKEMGELYKGAPAFWGSVSAVLAGQALPSAGAVVIVRNGRIIGAIGCSGGTGEQDHKCAEAGAAAVLS